jgi:hypothetical protein
VISVQAIMISFESLQIRWNHANWDHSPLFRSGSEERVLARVSKDGPQRSRPMVRDGASAPPHHEAVGGASASSCAGCCHNDTVILRSAPSRASRRMGHRARGPWFETALTRLLTMRAVRGASGSSGCCHSYAVILRCPPASAGLEGWAARAVAILRDGASRLLRMRAVCDAARVFTPPHY